MKPRKHADIIKAWADGADIQFRPPGNGPWIDYEDKDQTPSWSDFMEYRIKQEDKQDFVVNQHAEYSKKYGGVFKNKKPNLRLTFDGETGKLKAAEVLK